MSAQAILALSGFAMVAAFMGLIMSKRLSAVGALLLVPIAAALLLGQAADVGGHVMTGVVQVAPTVVLLIFAVLYFGVMIDAGLFDPLVKRIVAWVGSDPLRVTLGQTALTTVVALDGDGTTTVLVLASAILPIYRRLGMNPLIFALLGTLSGAMMNLTPWAGPSARVAAALKVSPTELFVPLLPAIAAGLATTFALAWWYGRRERARLRGHAAAEPQEVGALAALHGDEATARPRLFVFNLVLTAALMAGVILHVTSPQALFMAAFALALVVNYPELKEQRRRLVSHADGVLEVAVLALAAGVFTGVLSGSGMVGAMAGSVLSVLPPALGPYLAVITAGLSMPLSFFLSNDAYYFGVLPVIAKAGAAYGFSAGEIGRAALMGQPVHALSPLVATLYLKAGLIGMEAADLQRFIMRWAILVCLMSILAALATGAFALVGDAIAAGAATPER